MTPSRVQILDACVLINLLASGEAEPVLRAALRESLVCAAVRRESIYLRTDDPHSPLEPADISPLVELGLIKLCDVEGEEEARLYVDYASALDDGEAMSLAIALSRGFDLATDERKARRLFLEAAGAPKRLVSTSQLMRGWAEKDRVTAGRLKAALLRIEERARYQPPSTDVNYKWWNSACRAA